MTTLANARIFYESSQVPVAFAEMTPDSARTVFTASSKPWSNAPGYEYVVAPYGLLTGGAITAGATNDRINVAALTAMMPGATGASATTGVLSVNASTDTLTAVRGSAGSTNYKIDSVTINSSGALTMVAGTGSTAFSTTRGAAGGPPLIPVGSIEIGQIRMTSATSAAITTAEIFQVPGDSQELSDNPVYTPNPVRGTVTFAAALPAIHTGAVGKKVYVRCATPVFAMLGRAKDWVPAEATSSVSSEDYYDGPIGSVSSSISQASFSAALNDGVTDGILAKDGQDLLFKFMPDYNKAPYQITAGVFRKTRTYGVGANPTMSATVSAAVASVDFAS